MAATTQKSADPGPIITFAKDVRKRFSWLAVSLLIITFGFGRTSAQQFVPGRILIKPRPGVSETNFTAKIHSRGAVADRKLSRLNWRVVTVPQERSEQFLSELRQDTDIEFAERDYVAHAAFAPNDPYVASGTEWHLSRIDAADAWNFTAGSSNVVIAILDSGIDAAHPDLAGQVLPGYNFVGNTDDCADDFGHGTAVAGVAGAAGNNGIGVAGVAFGCRLLPVKVMDSTGVATYSSIAQGIQYAVDQGARLINISIVGASPSSVLQDAINYAWSNNAVVVAAAGNSASATPQYPAACDHVLGVSATEPDDSLAAFSSFGASVSLSAPGDAIWTTQLDPNNPYGSWRGTSLASPIVAGVAALVISQNPSLSNTQVVSILEQSADDLGAPGYDADFGYGRVNASAAVVAASLLPGALPPQPVAPISVTLSSPADSASFSLGASVPMNATVSIWQGSPIVTNVTFYANGVPIGTTGVAPFNVTWIPSAMGAYSLAVTATDDQGSTASSAPVLIEVVDPLTNGAPAGISYAPLTIRIAGLGTVVPNLDGKLLRIGKEYTVKAVPKPGQAFAGWSGAPSQSPLLSFVMQSNLVLEASFVPSPFPAAKGVYSGLIANSNSVTPGNSGGFTLAVTGSGLFTGKVQIGGGRYPFRGQFDLAGNTVVAVNRAGLAPLVAALHVDLTNGTDQARGSISDGSWVSGVTADRNVFNARSNPAQQAGLRAFILQRADNTAIEAGTGATKIALNGAAHVNGRLEDGRAFAAGSALAKNGDCPFFLSFGRGNEVVIGWLNFSATQAPLASGTVLWVRSGTNAFQATLCAASAP